MPPKKKAPVEKTVIKNLAPDPRTGMDTTSLEMDIVHHLRYTLAEDRYSSTHWDNYRGLVLSLLDRLHDRYLKTQQTVYHHPSTKRVYYFSMEYLVGRLLDNMLTNLGLVSEAKEALQRLGLDYEQLRHAEWDAGLGNGGLGRLAACFLDSMATLGIAGSGYGIRYDFGIFYQAIENGAQVEYPDKWLRYGNPWDLVRPEVQFPIEFYGDVIITKDDSDKVQFRWVNTQKVLAIAYDTPIPGYGNDVVNSLRLWKAESPNTFDLKSFNEGDYINAIRDMALHENISRVLYPSDKDFQGQELRLKQEYFLVSASLQDIIRRFKKSNHDWHKFASKVAVQCNDTHPILAIPELMRILLDKEGLSWEFSWDIVTKTFAYTNHTLMPEALEKWPVSLMRSLLPRHLELIYEINRRFLNQIKLSFPNDLNKAQRMSIISTDEKPHVRMAPLGILGSHKVNGVSALHTDLMKQTIFSDFYDLWPEKFINLTNGITPRRWLLQCNPALAELITQKMGDKWCTHLEELKKLEKWVDDPEFQSQFRAIKYHNKKRLVDHIYQKNNVRLNTDAIFDVQIKRMHEYKRQLLATLHTIALYNRIKANPGTHHQPRVVIFSGKAAPSYTMAKLHIHLINSVAEKIAADPVVSRYLQCAFIRNYSVSAAEMLIPAADLSEQISTAGFEASGTGNMKFALNGALTIGTLDGANVEMQEEIGAENMFIFGLTVEQIREMRLEGYRPMTYYENNPEIKLALDQIREGYFSPDEPGRFEPIVEALLERGDYFMVLADFEYYATMQQEVEAVYRQPAEWTKRAILNVARIGKFSSDRTIMEYATEVWGVKPFMRG